MPIETIRKGVGHLREFREIRRKHEFVISITHQLKDAGKMTEFARFKATRKTDRILDESDPENYHTEAYYYSQLPIAGDKEESDALVNLTAGVERHLKAAKDDYDGLRDLYLIAFPVQRGAPLDLQICGLYRSNGDVNLGDPTQQDILYIDNGRWVADKPFALTQDQLNFTGTDIIGCDLSFLPI
ncbi:hypothetical protein A3H78_01095 [Candidatus Roizmanbacteria bacterium RIFCSPLOWO2_02_FULL_36_11]|uniref:Uncharacterized protein n=1 Tax=Candidatus Roizmanbacteria bacterium RIFCSPLOWO2_02_FULL_36_11 TaxID=1802071 RepID=A0A1F7JIJ9_9BACT|nr:MAG: hypothetical protein A3H78_01095 [Candidatus Roizmanbacteria bacterium RIFCSPLOWO2_02_FULL_36_11]